MNRWRARLAELQSETCTSPARVQNVQNVQKSPSVLACEHFEQFERRPEPVPDTWADPEEERAAITEYDGGAPRDWAEALARLDPAGPPGDVPAKRWVQFIDDCGRFLDDGWASRVEPLGWRPLDLFGCDRERPFARVELAGLLWCLEGGRLLALAAETAIVETSTGQRQTYQRRPVEVGRVVLAWKLAPTAPIDHSRIEAAAAEFSSSREAEVI